MILLLALFACKDGQAPDPSDDSGVAVVDTEDETGLPVLSACEALGLPERGFDPSGTSGDFGELVPDFTWSTTAGPFTYSEHAEGCDLLLLVNYYPEYDYPVNLTKAGRIADLFETAPLNTRLFFFSYQSDQALIDAELADIEVKVGEALDFLEPELAAHWAGRVHFVSDSGWTADWVGALNQIYYESGVYVQWATGVDRFQRARELGYLCDPADGWATCSPEFLRYEAEYFNFEADRQARLDAETDVTILTAFDAEGLSDGGWAGVKGWAEVPFPDAATMAGFDTLELDLELACADYPAGVNCPAWDYLVNLYICPVDDPDTADVDEAEQCSSPVEFGRWITTYWRPGRWVHDLSPFLALLQEGGTRRFAFYTQQYYDVTLHFRLSNRGKGVRPVAMESLFTGGRFNQDYNWGRWHEIDAASWSAGLLESDTERFAITQRFDTHLVAQNGEDNRDNEGLWSRFDWHFSDDALHICHSEGAAETEEAALNAVYGCEEDDPLTEDVDESLICVGANPADLETGCNSGAWTQLTPAEGNDGAELDGRWMEIRHESKLPKAFTPPASAAKVELMGVITGHGFGDTRENCAEFCDHQHWFTVNEGEAQVYDQPWVGDTYGCAAQVPDGVIPNQSGTWVYGRGGWCPGQEVKPWVVDVSADVKAGEANVIDYKGLYKGEVYYPRYSSGGSSTGANILMNSWLVYYE